MKPIRDRRSRMLIMLSILLLGVVAGSIPNEIYSLDWYSVTGSGGSSSGGIYTLDASIAQPEAGLPLQGGEYTLQSGFWSGLAQAGDGYSVWLPLILRP